MQLLAYPRSQQFSDHVLHLDTRLVGGPIAVLASAAFERVMQMGEWPILLDSPLEIPEEDPADLERRVNQTYSEATVGELLESARLERGLGKRELARVMGTTHGRIGQLERAANLELKSVMEAAAALGYDLELSLIPRAGGRTLGAVVRLGSAVSV